MTRYILPIALGMCAAAILHASAPAPVPLRLLRGGEEAPGPATRRGPIVLAEVHAQPAARADGLDARFVELYNSNPFPHRLGGWTLSGALEFSFPQGYSIPALGRVVIAPHAADVATIYGLTGVLQASRADAFEYTAHLAQRLVQNEDCVAGVDLAVVCDHFVIDTGKPSDGGAAPFGSERRERLRIFVTVYRSCMTQKFCGSEGAVAASAVPSDFFHVMPP